MLIITAKISKKRAAWATATVIALILGLLILFLPGKNAPKEEPLPDHSGIATNEERLALLAECGLAPDPAPIATLDLQLPSPLDERYAAYNQLQLRQGFDLTPYCGKQVTRYTYSIQNHPASSQGVHANLYFCDHTLVAADLFCAGEDGFIEPLFGK